MNAFLLYIKIIAAEPKKSKSQIKGATKCQRRRRRKQTCQNKLLSSRQYFSIIFLSGQRLFDRLAKFRNLLAHAHTTRHTHTNSISISLSLFRFLVYLHSRFRSGIVHRQNISILIFIYIRVCVCVCVYHSKFNIYFISMR